MIFLRFDQPFQWGFSLNSYHTDTDSFTRLSYAGSRSHLTRVSSVRPFVQGHLRSGIVRVSALHTNVHKEGGVLSPLDYLL